MAEDSFREFSVDWAINVVLATSKTATKKDFKVFIVFVFAS